MGVGGSGVFSRDITRREVAPPKASSKYDPGNAVARNRCLNQVTNDLDEREAQRQHNLNEFVLPKGFTILM